MAVVAAGEAVVAISHRATRAAQARAAPVATGDEPLFGSEEQGTQEKVMAT